MVRTQRIALQVALSFEAMNAKINVNELALYRTLALSRTTFLLAKSNSFDLRFSIGSRAQARTRARARAKYESAFSC